MMLRNEINNCIKDACNMDVNPQPVGAVGGYVDLFVQR